ncbi:MAG: tRNA (cytosine(32)/uridine(32)-2'-O)-methyltransferase TrmJ [Acidobacteria bacterium]|nr:MAG: tRNA (cytosine(32)/uridine(32)-2'-O)-methyltransferase TrmJ [Acidobacteriota bacterium]
MGWTPQCRDAPWGVSGASGMTPPAVVLVRPREEGNVGSAARAMANMGLERLILVEPAAGIGKIATAFAVGARHVLDRLERAPDLHQALAPFRRVIGTTSTRDRRLGIPLLSPRELPGWLAQDGPEVPTALVFGPEVGGLTNEELALASAVVTIPCAPVQPTLNLAQAVLILAYELFLARGGETAPVSPPEPPASAAEIDGLLEHASQVLQRVGFARDDSYQGVLRDLRRLAARAAPDSRDVRILRGICRRIEGALGKREM